MAPPSRPPGFRLPCCALAFFLALAPLATPLAGEAQAAGKVYRIGVLSPFPSSYGPGPSFEAFRQTFRDLGYVDGRNVALEYRWADGRPDRLPDLAAELVRLGVDVVFSAWSTPAALATKKATNTIPVIFAGGRCRRGRIGR